MEYLKLGLYDSQYARFYDLIHDELTVDVPFILAMAGSSRKHILELGSGTGRLLIPLASAGHAVVGIEKSSQMIALARKNLQQLPHNGQVALVQGEMAAFRIERKFDLILFSHNTLNEFPVDEMKVALALAAEHLSPGGKVLLDLINPSGITLFIEDDVESFERSFVDPLSGQRIIQSSEVEIDLNQGLIHVRWLFRLVNGGEPAEILFTHETNYHMIYPHELELLLRACGLQMESLYGGYDQEPYGEDSDRLLVMATHHRDVGKTRW